MSGFRPERRIFYTHFLEQSMQRGLIERTIAITLPPSLDHSDRVPLLR